MTREGRLSGRVAPEHAGQQHVDLRAVARQGQQQALVGLPAAMAARRDLADGQARPPFADDVAVIGKNSFPVLLE